MPWRRRPTLEVAAALLVGFGLGAWFGSRRTIGQIERYAGPEKWERIRRAGRRPCPAKPPARP